MVNAVSLFLVEEVCDFYDVYVFHVSAVRSLPQHLVCAPHDVNLCRTVSGHSLSNVYVFHLALASSLIRGVQFEGLKTHESLNCVSLLM